MASTTSTRDRTQKDSDILQRIAIDDKTAIENCFDVYGNLVWGLAKKYCYTREDIEDVKNCGRLYLNRFLRGSGARAGGGG